LFVGTDKLEHVLKMSSIQIEFQCYHFHHCVLLGVEASL